MLSSLTTLDALQRAFGSGDKPPSLFRSYPLFGGIISPSDHFLIDESDELVRRLLVVIGLEFPLVDYCPSMPDIRKLSLFYYYYFFILPLSSVPTI